MFTFESFSPFLWNISLKNRNHRSPYLGNQKLSISSFKAL